MYIFFIDVHVNQSRIARSLVHTSRKQEVGVNGHQSTTTRLATENMDKRVYVYNVSM